MPLNVPVTLTVPPIDRRFTVHTDRQRWSAEQLASEPDGRAALEAAVREGVLSDDDRRQHRASFGFMLVGVLCAAAGGAMSQYDYTKPEGTSPGTNINVWIWTNVDSLCDHLAFPAVVAGTLLVLFGFGRLALTK